MNETSSSIVTGIARYWLYWLWVQLTKVSSLTTWLPRFEKRQSWIAKIRAEFITHVSLVLLGRVLHEGQNHLFPDDLRANLSISRFSSETEEHRQVLKDAVVLTVLEIRQLLANDTPLSSSKTTCSITATSYWEFKSKGVTFMLDKLHFKVHKNLDRSISFWWNFF